MKSRYSIILMLLSAVVLVSCSGGGAALQSLPAVAGGGLQAGETATPTGEALVDANRVHVEGHIVPRDSTTLMFNRSGKIAQVLVKEGEQVRAGQVLARLGDREALDAALKQAQFEQLSAQQAVDDLNRNAHQAYAEALQAVATARTALEDAQDKRSWLNGKNGSKEQIAAAKAQITVLDETIDQLQDLYDSLKDVEGKELERAEAKVKLEKTKTDRILAQYNYDWLNSNVASKDVAVADANLVKAEADLKTAQDMAQRRANGPDTEAMALAQARLENAQAQVVAAQKAITDLDLVAPYDGTVVQINYSVGDLVTPTQVICQFADLADLYVETSDLTELKVVKIDATQPVEVVPDALPDLKLSGHIELIRDNYVDKSGDITYVVRVRLEHPDPRLRWGMTVDTIFGVQ